MRTVTLFIILLFSNTTFAQQEGKTFIFKEVGWTIVLPREFKILDSATDSAITERGIRAVEETNNIQADVSRTRTLISATKNTYNYFNSTITPFNVKEDGDYNTANLEVKAVLYNTFKEKIPTGKIDTVTSQETIDNILFEKFHVLITINHETQLNMILLYKHYKGYDFGISYLYLDDRTKVQIENMLRNSRFTK